MPHILSSTGKKRREILETAAKRISAYAWSPLWSLSNKRRSFNLVATGAFHSTLLSGKKSQCSPLMSPMSYLTSQSSWTSHLRTSCSQHVFNVSSFNFNDMTEERKTQCASSVFYDKQRISPGLSSHQSIASLLLTARVTPALWSSASLHGNWHTGNCFSQPEHLRWERLKISEKELKIVLPDAGRGGSDFFQ